MGTSRLNERAVAPRHPWLITLDRLTYRLSRASGRLARGSSKVDLESDFPWTSPNIWRYVEAACAEKPGTSVFEYGAGVSSAWHIRNLIPLGGSYTAVEHDPAWYEVVVEWLADRARTVGGGDFRRLESSGGNCEVQVSLGYEDGACSVRLLLRPAKTGLGTNETTAQRYASYISALDSAADIVVIDGRARVDCVNHVLDRGLVSPGGLLALYEAGRGRDGWLGRPALTGDHDYRAVVKRMCDAGGWIADGEGLDAWPGLKGRRAGVNARYYPAEACLLRAGD